MLRPLTLGSIRLDSRSRQACLRSHLRLICHLSRDCGQRRATSDFNGSNPPTLNPKLTGLCCEYLRTLSTGSGQSEVEEPFNIFRIGWDKVARMQEDDEWADEYGQHAEDEALFACLKFWEFSIRG